MADWTEQYPVDFTVTGDQTNEAIEKHIIDISMIYSQLTRVRKWDAGASPPPDPVIYHGWLDPTDPTKIIAKVWDGSQWVSVLRVSFADKVMPDSDGSHDYPVNLGMGLGLY